MKESALTKKSYQFAIRSVKLYKHLTETKREFVISKQFLKSGTSVGAMICEAGFAQSKKDFISKLGIAAKEANETKYWLDLLKEADYIDQDLYDSMITDVTELIRILTTSIKTSKNSLGNNQS